MTSKNVLNLMPVYEANYRKLAELVPHFANIEQAIVLGKQDQVSVHLRFVERFKYTSTMLLACYTIDENKHVPNAHLKIRIYHDARVAEVLSFQGHSRIEAIYAYPNPHMYHRDEKRQINRFLSELLDYCLLKGYLFNIEHANSEI